MTSLPSPSSLLDRVGSVSRLIPGLVVPGLVVLVLVPAGWLLVVATGGTPNAWAHVMYVPIVVAAGAWGFRGALAVALVAGVLLGPLSPHDPSMSAGEFHASWLNRLVFFLLIGSLVAWGLDQLRVREARFRALVQGAGDLIVLADADGSVRYASPASSSILGFEPDDLVGTRLGELVHEDDDPTAVFDEPRVVRVRHRDGSFRHLEVLVRDLRDDSAVGALVVNARDVTERIALQARVHYQSLHDPPTGLANRVLLADRLANALARQRRLRRPLAVFAVALDRFDVVRASLDHDAAESLLAALGQRLVGRLRPADTVARVGDDDLAVLCEESDGVGTSTLAERILAGVREPFVVDGEEVYVTASVGATVVEDPSVVPDEVLRRASSAAGVVRARGGDGFVADVEARPERAAQRLRAETQLHQALARDELRVHYQPVVRVLTGQVESVEALVRWEHPEAGLLEPSHFLPLAEETGLIVAISEVVLDEACAQLRCWRDAGGALERLGMAVNVSGGHLLGTRLVELVEATLRRHRVPASALTVEITESEMVERSGDSLAQLDALRALGVGVAVDDFGTGYSSLGYLKRLPVDAVKIDRLFVADLARDAADEAIVSAVVGLAHSLGLPAIAEGVETREQLTMLGELGCDFAQGFFFSRPLDPGELEALFSQGAHFPTASPARVL